MSPIAIRVRTLPIVSRVSRKGKAYKVFTVFLPKPQKLKKEQDNEYISHYLCSILDPQKNQENNNNSVGLMVLKILDSGSKVSYLIKV